MKKLLILGIFLASVSLNIKAQDMQPKVGIKAGGNLMMGGKLDILGKEYTSKYVPGFHAGVVLDLPLSSTLSFSPEVLYSQKGAKFEDPSLNGEIKTKIGYIDVPVLLTFNATPEFNFVFGPQASFLVNQETITTLAGISTSSKSKDDFRKSIAAGVVGMGYKFSPNLNVNARYSMDFQSASTDNINQDKSRLSGFALSLGYSF